MGSAARARAVIERREARDEPTGLWLQPPTTDTYHHSTSYDGYEHGTACGRTFDEAPFGVVMDAEDLPADADYCETCLRVGGFGKADPFVWGEDR